jgi:hypothetical protein
MVWYLIRDRENFVCSGKCLDVNVRFGIKNTHGALSLLVRTEECINMEIRILYDKHLHRTSARV